MTERPPHRVRHRADVVTRRVDDRLVGLDLRTSRYFSLNDSGAALWALLDEPRGADALVEHLVAVYGTDPGRARVDVHAVLDLLARWQLTEDAPG